MIVTHKKNGGLVILGTDQEKLLANILHYVINQSEIYSDPVMRINVENLKNALGI
jgi:hypothetical protein